MSNTAWITIQVHEITFDWELAEYVKSNMCVCLYELSLVRDHKSP